MSRIGQTSTNNNNNNNNTRRLPQKKRILKSLQQDITISNNQNVTVAINNPLPQGTHLNISNNNTVNLNINSSRTASTQSQEPRQETSLQSSKKRKNIILKEIADHNKQGRVPEKLFSDSRIVRSTRSRTVNYKDESSDDDRKPAAKKNPPKQG